VADLSWSDGGKVLHIHKKDGSSEKVELNRTVAVQAAEASYGKLPKMPRPPRVIRKLE